jgi:hypothetical protein
LSGIDQIFAELIQSHDGTLHSDAHKLIDSIWIKKELPQQWKDSVVFVFVKREVKLTVVTEECHFINFIQNFNPQVLSQGSLHT